MTQEELILQKLEYLESQIMPVITFGKNLKELKDDLVPLGNSAMHMVIKELQEVEAGFELADFLMLVKQTMRSTRDLIFTLRQLSSVIEFMKDLEPLMKSAVPLVIEHLDRLEQQGIFRIIKSTMDVRAKVAANYDTDDIDVISDFLVAMMGFVRKLNDPKAMAFMEHIAGLPARIDVENAKKTGMGGLIASGFNGDVREGLGILLELIKALGRIKESPGADTEPPGKGA